MLNTLAVVVAILVTAPGDDNRASATPVAESCFAAIQASNIDGPEPLFAASSSIVENGHSEGTWRQYRAHHLSPEIGQIAKFDIDLGENDAVASENGSLADVEWAITYRLDLKKGRRVQREAAVTVVQIRELSAYRIRHLHWSSRAPKKKARRMQRAIRAL